MRLSHYVLPLAAGVLLSACGGAPMAQNVPYASLKGSAAAGEKAFVACRACHQGGSSTLGPRLTGVVGRLAGSLPDYPYSAAMKAHNQVWSEPHLYEFLARPQGTVPGTRMSYGGITDPQQRADLIAYLRTLR